MAKIFDRAKALADRIPTEDLLEHYFMSLAQSLHADDIDKVAETLMEFADRKRKTVGGAS